MGVRVPAAAALLRRQPVRARNEEAYARWRDRKLAARARSAADLVVEVGDPRALTPAEKARSSAAAGSTTWPSTRARHGPGQVRAPAPGRAARARHARHQLPRGRGRHHEHRRHRREGDGGFIPYTTHRIRWHTDGYYNPPQLRIRAMLLHCVRDAASGGDTALLDHELAYLLLREDDPAHVAALMAPDALAIPARVDEEEWPDPKPRGRSSRRIPHGRPAHALHRATRSVAWKDDAATAAAAARLAAILDGDSGSFCARASCPAWARVQQRAPREERLRGRSRPPAPAVRARYVERIAGTERSWT